MWVKPGQASVHLLRSVRIDTSKSNTNNTTIQGKRKNQTNNQRIVVVIFLCLHFMSIQFEFTYEPPATDVVHKYLCVGLLLVERAAITHSNLLEPPWHVGVGTVYTSELLPPHHDVVTALHLSVLRVGPLSTVPGHYNLPLKNAAAHQGTWGTVVPRPELGGPHDHVLQHQVPASPVLTPHAGYHCQHWNISDHVTTTNVTCCVAQYNTLCGPALWGHQAHHPHQSRTQTTKTTFRLHDTSLSSTEVYRCS